MTHHTHSTAALRHMDHRPHNTGLFRRLYNAMDLAHQHRARWKNDDVPGDTGNMCPADWDVPAYWRL